MEPNPPAAGEPLHPADIIRETTSALGLLQASLQSQVSEFRHAIKTEVREAGLDFHRESERARLELQKHLSHAIGEAQRAADGFKRAHAIYARQRKWALWGMGVVTALCLITLVYAWQAVHGGYRERLDQLRAQVAYLETVNRAKVAPCGDQQLCAEIDLKAPRYGDQKQYYVVKPR